MRELILRRENRLGVRRVALSLLLGIALAGPAAAAGPESVVSFGDSITCEVCNDGSCLTQLPDLVDPALVSEDKVLLAGTGLAAVDDQACLVPR
jgi:hypothetical protein